MNETLASAPEKLNADPHGEAWLVKIKLTAPGEIGQALSRPRITKPTWEPSNPTCAICRSPIRSAARCSTLWACRAIEDLFAHLPQDALLNRPLDLPPGKSEYEIADYFRERGAENANGFASFLGAGVYHHYRPVLVDTVVSRGEFLTSYTPYQAEISQGTLTRSSSSRPCSAS